MRVPQRGRAILRRLSTHETVQAFRPGDFVLTHSNAGLARVLGWASGSKLNHAAIIIDPTGTVAEATPSLFRDSRAFRLASVADYLRAGKPCWIGYVELREGSRQEVVAYIEHLLRGQGTVTMLGRVWLLLHAAFGTAPRMWTGRVPWLHALHRFFARRSPVLREEHCFSSGEMVARALERGGFIWESDPANVTPADLFNRYHLKEEPVHLGGMRITPIARAARPTRPALAASPGTPSVPAPITPFALRGTRGGAVALAEAPRDTPTQAGIRALMRVGILTAAGLAVIGMVEELLRLASPDV